MVIITFKICRRSTEIHLANLPPGIQKKSSRELDTNAGPRALKKRRFTEEEKKAIKDGVNIFGVGKWADIKALYAVQLRHRTSVQIKDCYRTMQKYVGANV